MLKTSNSNKLINFDLILLFELNPNKYQKKYCKSCKKIFITHKKNKVYCSIKCRNDYANGNSLESYYKHKEYYRYRQHLFMKRLRKNMYVFGMKRIHFICLIKREVFKLALTHHYLTHKFILSELFNLTKINISNFRSISFIISNLPFLQKFNKTCYISLISKRSCK